MSSSTPHRRDVLAGVCGLMLAGFAGVEFANPAEAAGITKLKNGKVQLRISQVKQLAKVGGVVLVSNSSNVAIAVTRTGPKSFAAFDLACPHQRVRVDAIAGSKIWTCPAHGSQFDSTTGAVLAGPAPQGLTKLKTVLKADILTVG